jgi:lysosomal acid lipase/cholesteryl ester hydrolase
VFRKYDYGEKKNPKYYDGSLVPPDYLIENITAPIYIFYGNGDKLIITKDVKMLSNALPSLEMMYEVNYTGWNHNDFVYAIDAKNLVYDIIISHMNDYRNNATISMEP